MKCVEKFKKVIAKEMDKDKDDISWSEAMAVWIERGYAVKFSDLYDEKCKFRDIYRKVMAE
jgi:hypothetical protein